jgi:Fe-S-cluster formation regulator IscX/YfhJ
MFLCWFRDSHRLLIKITFNDAVDLKRPTTIHFTQMSLSPARVFRGDPNNSTSKILTPVQQSYKIILTL